MNSRCTGISLTSHVVKIVLTACRVYQDTTAVSCTLYICSGCFQGHDHCSVAVVKVIMIPADAHRFTQNVPRIRQVRILASDVPSKHLEA